MSGIAPPVPSVFEPVSLGPLRLRNRVIKAATFEGMTPGGRVTDELVEFHLRVARGGVGMTTVAYCAVSPGGRVMPDCLVLDEPTAQQLRSLTDAVHEEGAEVSAQIGHAGLVADARANRARSIAPSLLPSPVALAMTRAASTRDLDALAAQYAAATRNAVAAGFDAVEVHLGHHYLLSSFLSPLLNRRRDAYGGSLESRARFPRRVLEAVREAAGPRVAVLAKLNMTDGVPGGLQVAESVRVARMLEADGTVDAIELTGGGSLLNAMYLFRGDVPLAEMADAYPGVRGLGLRLAGRMILREYPFEEAYFLEDARHFRAALKLPLVLLGGINRVETMRTAMAEGFELVAMGRALLREPDLIARMQSGAAAEGRCIHCNRCVPTIYSGTRCVLVEDDDAGADADGSAGAPLSRGG